MRIGNISISEGNRKLGGVPSFSVPPIITCPKWAPCTKECYAVRMVKRLPNVDAAYRQNLLALSTDPGLVYEAIALYIRANSPRRFRFNIAGDFYNYSYLMMVVRLANAFPDVHFLAYSKQDFIVDDVLQGIPGLPKNFSLILSAWKERMPYNPHNLPVAYYQDGSCVVPENGFVCPGKCYQCGFKCWDLKEGESVIFNRH